MNTKSKLAGLLLFGALNISALNALFAEDDALSVTITPSESRIIKVGTGVNLSCEPTGGCPPYTYSWSIPGADGNPPTDQKNPGNVTFGSSAEGNVNTVSVTVTDANNETANASVEIGVPKFAGFDDIWFFEDGQGDATYPVERDITITGIPSGKTVTWRIAGQSNAIKFNNNQQQITGEDTTRKIKSIGWSTNENNLTLEIVYSGNTVATSEDFTARAPTQITQVSYVTDTQLGGPSGPGTLTSGFSSRYEFKVTDKFTQLLPGAQVSENFPSSWTSDWSGENWGTPSSNAVTLSGSSQFGDEYAYQTVSGTPTTVLPTDSAASQKVKHSDQDYKVGGSGSGASATGFIVKDHKVQYCRGRAYQF